MSEHERQDEADSRLWQRLAASAGSPSGPCPDATDLASYLDGRSSDETAERIEGHLASCEQCLAAVRELRSLLSPGPVLPPATLIERAKSLVPADAARDARRTAGRRDVAWRRMSRWAAAAAAAVLISVAGFRTGLAAGRDPAREEMALVRELTFGLEETPDGQAWMDDEVTLLFEETEE